jgi:hypothetical protein
MIDYLDNDRPEKKYNTAGNTFADLKKYHEQCANDDVDMVPASGEDPEFEVPAITEFTHYYVRVWNKYFDSATGEPLTTPRVVCYTIPMFDEVMKNGFLSGYSEVKVLHNPLQAKLKNSGVKADIA